MRVITEEFAVPVRRREPGASDRHLRHAVSRRAFIAGGAGAAGVALGAGMLEPLTVRAGRAANPAPKPTTSTVTLNGVTFSLVFFGPGLDPSSITDFNGFVGVADVQGTGTATNSDGSTEMLLFDTDMRFMSGVYVAQDGSTHKATFGFV
jgi:hypothetical protein